MHVGIDLAWGPNGRTGLAAVDDDGRLLGTATVRTDPEINAWLDGHASPLVVAVDAPIVVTNDRGQRGAERAISAAWGRFHAGTHPTNRATRHMDPPRALRLAERRGWEIDPVERRADRTACIEVYPHPGMVGLFGLDRILRYKKGPWPPRRAEFARLLDLLEGLPALRLPASAAWSDIRERFAAAASLADLDRLEDEVDAVFCAHLAWRWAQHGGGLIAYGERAEGRIIAPLPIGGTGNDPEPPEVGVGPHPAPWPVDPRLDPDLLERGDRRNVVDRYRYWTVEAIAADLALRRHPFAVAIENWQHDANIGSIVRTANAFAADSVHIVGNRRWNRRGAMVTDRYQRVVHHADVAALLEWARGAGLAVIAVDNLPSAVPIETFALPKACLLLFGQEGPGLTEPALTGADAIVGIPQYGSTRSINAGAAAAIAMHEWIRRWAPPA